MPPKTTKQNLGINLTKEVKDLHSENCKTLIKETEDDWKEMERYSMALELKELILLKWLYHPKHLWIYCNPYQIFHITRANNPNMYMEPQKTQNCQSNWGKRTKMEAYPSQTLDNTTKLQ